MSKIGWIYLWLGLVLVMASLTIDKNDTYQPRTYGGQDWNLR